MYTNLCPVSRLSLQELCNNSWTWAHDVQLLIEGADETTEFSTS